MRRAKKPSTQAPAWTPIHPNRAPRIARCRSAWENRAVPGDDDWTPAEHVSTNYSWDACPDGVPWAALKAAWGVDEANPALGCVLCHGALAARSFGHALTAGGIVRECLWCRVAYVDHCGHSGVSAWLRLLPAEVRPNRFSMSFSTRGGGVPGDPPEPDALAREWSRFVRAGHWSQAVPRKWGTYVTATAEGPFTTRTIELDEGAIPRRAEHRGYNGWWWTERLPDGVETLPFGPDDSWTTKPRRTPDAE